MKYRTIYQFCLIALLFVGLSCAQEIQDENAKDLFPSVEHDLGYIPYNSESDNAEFFVCDSTQILSGRNRIQYSEGVERLKADIRSRFIYKKEYESFNGFIITRFLVNCEGKTGRFRSQSLHYDFSRNETPSDLLKSTRSIIQGLQHWVKDSGKADSKEYLKFINLRFKDGKIQHVLL